MPADRGWYSAPTAYVRLHGRASETVTSTARDIVSGSVGNVETSIFWKMPRRARFCCVSRSFVSEKGEPSLFARRSSTMKGCVRRLPRRIVLPKVTGVPSVTVYVTSARSPSGGTGSRKRADDSTFAST